MADNFSPMPVKGLLAHNSSASTTNLLGVLPALVSTAEPSLTTGTNAALSLDTAGSLRATITSGSVSLTGTPAVNISQFGGTTVSIGQKTAAASIPVVLPTTQLPTAAALADAVANPTLSGIATYLLGYNGTTWDRLRSSTANGLAVDVTRVQGSVTVAQATAANLNATVTGTVTANAGTGNFGVNLTQVNGTAIATAAVPVSRTTAANSLSNAIYTQLSDGTAVLGVAANPLVVTSDPAGAAKFSVVTSSALAAGGTTTLSSAAVTTGKTGYLEDAWITSSVRLKATVQGNTAGTPTVFAVLFVEANTTFHFNMNTTRVFPQTGGATNNFQIVFVNMDNANAADVYATLAWEEL